jgi:predicted molibdopterin-dependent oxidoreductase YjgC
MYRKMENDEARASFEARWGVPIRKERGYMLPEMLVAATERKLKAMYVYGYDIAQSEPNTEHVENALRSLELLVVHDIFECDTARFAHVVLPGSSFLEKTGTFTNAERRVQMVREAVPPPGEARRDLDVLLELSERLGYRMGHTTAAEVMDEIAALTPQLRGITHERLGTQGLQWPVPTEEHAGTPVLFTQAFQTKSGKGSLFAVDWEPPGEAASEAYPFILITGRQLAHYNSGTQTRRTDNATLQSADFVEIHPMDAERIGVKDGDHVEIASARGKVATWARVTTRVALGNVFVSFHFPEMKTNVLTSASTDPLTRCPEYKVTAVAVRKTAEQPPAPAIARGFRQDAHD